MVLIPSTNDNANCGCNCGELPYTITATFSGMDGTEVQTARQTYVVSSCTGSGAVGIPIAGGDCDKTLVDIDSYYSVIHPPGNATAFAIVSPGHCYAVLGRKEPALVAETTGSGSGIEFGELKLSPVAANGELPKDCGNQYSGLPYWEIISLPVNVANATGYVEGDAVIVRAGNDRTFLGYSVGYPTGAGGSPFPGQPFRASLIIDRVAPDVDVVVDTANGKGASFTTSTTYIAADQYPPCSKPHWQITSINVTDGGSGYVTYEAVSIAPKADSYLKTGDRPFSGYVVCDDAVPQGFDATVHSQTGHAEGAELELQWTSLRDGLLKWQASSATVLYGGSGYSVDDIITLSKSGFRVCVRVAHVDANGAVSGVTVIKSDKFPSGGGPITSVVIDAQSSTQSRYYGLHVSGVSTKQTATSCNPFYDAYFYETNPDANAIVPESTVLLSGTPSTPIDGYSATIDSDPSSLTFGQVTAITGSGGPAWLRSTCSTEWDSFPSVVLRAVDPIRLVTLEISSDFGGGACAEVVTTQRVEPPLEIDLRAATACPAQTSVSLTMETGDDKEPYWTITGATATGGSGYGANADGNQIITGVLPLCDTVEQTVGPEEIGGEIYDNIPQSAEIHILVADTERGILGGATVVKGGGYYQVGEYDGQPTGIRKVTPVSPGSGYALLGREAPSLNNDSNWHFQLQGKQDEFGHPYWTVIGLNPSDGSLNGRLDGYLEGIGVPYPPDENVEIEKCFIEILNRRDAPQSLSAFIVDASSLCGSVTATFSISFEEIVGAPRRTWKVSSITGQGSAGASGQLPLEFWASFPTRESRSAVAVVTADENFSVTGVTVTDGGEYFLDTLECESFEIVNGGKFYKENPDLPPIVADVTVSIVQLPPSNGSGASVQAVIDTDTSSPSFGQIVSYNVTSGSGYTLLGGPRECRWVNQEIFGGWPTSCIELKARGNGLPPEVTFNPGGVGTPVPFPGDPIGFRAASALGRCDHLPDASVLYGASGGSVTLTYGGVWNNCGQQNVCKCQPLGCCQDASGNQSVIEDPILGGSLNRPLLQLGPICRCENFGLTYTPRSECGCCCVDGKADTSKKSACECTAAGATWIPNKSCSSADCYGVEKGACCRPCNVQGSFCADNGDGSYTRADCERDGGVFHQGKRCDADNPCGCPRNIYDTGWNCCGNPLP